MWRWLEVWLGRGVSWTWRTSWTGYRVKDAHRSVMKKHGETFKKLSEGDRGYGGGILCDDCGEDVHAPNCPRLQRVDKQSKKDV